MKRFTRSASTWFQVLPSTLKCVPITQPEATDITSATLSMLTPVLAKTGTSVTVSHTLRRSDWLAGWPVIGPETSTASASEENTADLARSSIGRWSSEWANSALMLKSIFMFLRPRLARKREADAQSGSQMPMSEAKTPVKISRTKLAPVIEPMATELIGSHR